MYGTVPVLNSIVHIILLQSQSSLLQSINVMQVISDTLVLTYVHMYTKHMQENNIVQRQVRNST